MIFDSLTPLWTLTESFKAQLISAAIAILIAIARYYLQPSVRLRWGRTNNSYHKLPTENGHVSIYVEKHYLQNAGRKPATNVEFVYSFKPSEVSVWEPRNYTKKETPDGQFVLTLPQIAPKELVIVDSIYADLTSAEVVSVKSADCLGKQVEFIVNRNFGVIFNGIVFLLLFMGIVYTLSLVIQFLFG